MKTYSGQCHCGTVKFEFSSEPIEKGLRCTCSICVRKGTVMSPDALDADNLKINAKSEDLGLYQFAAKTAKHYFCTNCGIYTHHETARFPGKFRVNLGCIDELDPLSLEIDVFDGKNLL